MRLKDIETEDVASELLTWGVMGVPASIADVVLYAKTGIGDYSTELGALGISRAVYSAPHPDHRPNARALLESNRGELTTATDVVLYAARCRLNLAAWLPVTTKQLAALSSMAHGSLKMAGTRGSITISKGRVQNEEARRWLAARGVPGFKQEAGE